MLKKNPILVLWLSAIALAAILPPSCAMILIEHERLGSAIVIGTQVVMRALASYVQLVPMPVDFIFQFLPGPHLTTTTDKALALVGMSFVFGLSLSDVVGKVLLVSMLYRWVSVHSTNVRVIERWLPSMTQVGTGAFMFSGCVIALVGLLVWPSIHFGDPGVASGVAKLSAIACGAAVANALGYTCAIAVLRRLTRIS